MRPCLQIHAIKSKGDKSLAFWDYLKNYYTQEYLVSKIRYFPNIYRILMRERDYVRS